MQRGFRFLMLIVVAASIVGCGGEADINSEPPSQTAAKDAAAKMPPPPGMKTGAPKAH